MVPVYVDRFAREGLQGGSRDHAAAYRDLEFRACPGRRSETDRERDSKCPPDALWRLADRLGHRQRRSDRTGAVPPQDCPERQAQYCQPRDHPCEPRHGGDPVDRLHHQSRQVSPRNRPHHSGRAHPPGNLQVRRRRTDRLLFESRGESPASRVRVQAGLVPHVASSPARRGRHAWEAAGRLRVLAGRGAACRQDADRLIDQPGEHVQRPQADPGRTGPRARPAGRELGDPVHRRRR